MANPDHVDILYRGAMVWNSWRIQNPDIVPDLSNAHLSEHKLSMVNFAHANLRTTNLFESDLSGGIFCGADMTECDLSFCDLIGANFEKATLCSAQMTMVQALNANFVQANLKDAVLTAAIMTGADLTEARISDALLNGTQFVRSNLHNADISRSNVYGVSVWDSNLEGCSQENLVITPAELNYSITVNEIAIAQFMYLILNNTQLHQFIETSTKKVVLILGRFTQLRKEILDIIRIEMQKRNYIPIIFDFEPSSDRNLTETISLLAHMCKFIVADISEPKSVPQELQRIIPDLPSVQIVPILEQGQEPYSMFEDFKSYPWVHSVIEYYSKVHLVEVTIAEILSKVGERS